MNNRINCEAAQIYCRAAEYIENIGWQREGMGADGVPRCSMGALESAYPKRHWNSKMSVLMYKALQNELDGMSLTEFNMRANGGADVARLFRKVALSLRATES